MDISNVKNATLISGTTYADKILNKGEKVTVKAGSGNDDVENYGENSKIYLSYGDDYTRNYAAKVTIDSNNGNDRILNYGKNVSIVGGAGYDGVENYGDYTAIKISGGDNNIYNEGDGSKITGGSGNDTIDNKGDKTIIQSGSGNDFITSNGEHVSIDSGANDNRIVNHGNYASIKSGVGKNDISNYGDNVTITSGKGNDLIDNYGEYVSVNMSDGDNYIYDYNDHTTIIGGSGNDTIFSTGDVGLFKTGGGNDSIVATGDYFTVDAGAGNDNISVRSDYTSISGGAGNDVINSFGDFNYINGGDGNDIIAGDGDYVTIEGGKGDNIIMLNGDAVKVVLTDGNNEIAFFNASKNSSVITGTGNDNISLEENSSVLIEAGTGGTDKISGFSSGDTIKMASEVKKSYVDGNDFVIEFAKGSFRISDYGFSSIQAITASGETVTLNVQPEGQNITNTKSGISVTGGDGADTITNSGAKVTIDSGDGNDEVTNSGTNSKIVTGLGKHTVNNSGANTLIDGGKGNLTVTNSGKGATINGGKDSNTITNTADSVLIVGGKDYDRITTSGKNVTVKCGEGIDNIEINGENTGTVIEYSEGDSGVLIVSGMGSNDTLDLKGEDYIRIDSGGYYSVLVGDKLLSFITKEDFKIIGTKIASETYTIKKDENFTVNGVTYTASGGNAVINLDSDGKITGLKSGKIIASVDEVTVTIDATKGAENFIAETDNSRLIITKTFPITFIEGDFTYNGETLTADENSQFAIVAEGDNYSHTRSVTSDFQSTYKITDTEMFIESKGSIITDVIIENNESFVINAEFSGNVTSNFIENSIKFTKGSTGNIIFNDYICTATALDNSGSKLFLDMDNVIFTPDSGAMNISLNYFGNKEIISGDLKCTKGKITVGYDNKINLEKDTSFEFKKNGYTLTATATDESKVSIQVDDNSITLTPVEDENSLHLTLKNGNTTIFDNTLRISGGSVVLTQTDNADRKKISLTQGTTIEIEKDDTIITATAKSDVSAYIWRNTKGEIYFKIDGESANFDINIAQSDGTEIFNGEMTFGGGVTFDEKNKALAFVSDSDPIEGYETFVQLKDDTRTIYAQTAGKTVIANLQLKDGKITANFKKKGNNSLLLSITKDEKEVLNNVITVDGSIVVDLLQADFSANKGTTITTDSGLTIKNSLLTVSKDFSGSAIDLTTYEKTATKADASKISSSIIIKGNDSANSIKGGKADDIITGEDGNDTIYGGKGNDFISGDADNDKLLGEAGDDTLNGGFGNDTLTGGKGADVFIYEGGNDLITDYKAGEDSILLNYDAITSSSVKGSNVILTTEKGTLTIKGTKDKAITFIDEDGNATDKIFFADTSYSPLETGLSYDAKRTILTASSKFEGYMINLNDHISTVAKINASAVNQEIVILGNDLNNSIVGGKNGDLISGDSGNDTLTGGAGNDTFYCDSGDDVITDYKAGEDSIIVSEKISKVEYSGQNVILTYGENTITFKNAKGKEISVTDSSGETQIYSNTLDILCDNNFVTDEFGIDDVVDVTENNYSVGKIETSENNNVLADNSIVSAYSFDENS